MAVSVSSEAAPGSRICRQLQAQLSGGGQSAKFSSALARQRNELAKVRGMMRAQGCGFFSSGGSCSSLSAAASRMERNMSSLQSGLARSGGRSRSQILAALDANDCNGAPVVAAREPSFLSRLFGAPDNRRSRSAFVKVMPEEASVEPDDEFQPIRPSQRRNDDSRRDDGRDRIEKPAGPSISYGGAYRTYCVRTCDGYYFPMSPSSSRSDFARDAQNCQTACPGAEMQVYYHSGNDEDAGEMVSAASGRQYADLSTAFVYKQENAPARAVCGCGIPQQGFKVVAGNYKPDVQTIKAEISTDTASAAPAMPMPSARPDPADDPETLLNREGKFGPAQVRKLLGNGDGPETDARKIRVVGPAFLPDPAKAIVRPVPGQTEVQ